MIQETVGEHDIKCSELAQWLRFHISNMSFKARVEFVQLRNVFRASVHSYNFAAFRNEELGQVSNAASDV
jgi:hypothetical protein